MGWGGFGTVLEYTISFFFVEASWTGKLPVRQTIEDTTVTPSNYTHYPNTGPYTQEVGRMGGDAKTKSHTTKPRHTTRNTPGVPVVVLHRRYSPLSLLQTCGTLRTHVGETRTGVLEEVVRMTKKMLFLIWITNR